MKTEFDKIIKDKYGIISGNKKLIFVKTGRGGTCYGYNNKYLNLANEISNLYGEIEKMKPCAEDEQKAMFDSITKMAKEFPLVNEYREKVCNIEAKLYISCLAFLVLGDEGNVYEKLLYSRVLL